MTSTSAFPVGSSFVLPGTPAPPVEFKAWPKTPRLSKTQVVITEKIDGTNAAVIVTVDGRVLAQSRKRIITPGKGTDNYGFAAWVEENAEELRRLGPGYHYGEWWGNGIQRGYDQDHKSFALFDVDRWTYATGSRHLPSADVPPCCGVVPTLVRCAAIQLGEAVEACLDGLREHGSQAAPGFMRPEGICVVHDRRTYKVLLENDDKHKGQVAA